MPTGTWSGPVSAPVRTQNNNLYVGTDNTSNAIALDVSQLQFSNSTWFGSISWFYPDNSTYVSVGSTGSGSFSLSDSTAVPSEPNWYTIVSTL